MFLEFNENILKEIKTPFGSINSFIKKDEQNIDQKTIDSFGEEWSKFDYFSKEEIEQVGNDYFDILPDNILEKETTTILDAGCGTGRWAKYLADKVKVIECIDPSNAVLTAQHLLKKNENVRISKASVNHIPFANESFDFVFSLGVLHHIPDTEEGIKKCVEKVKYGGYFLVYLYYNLDNRGISFKIMFWLTNIVRLFISKLPQKLKSLLCDLLACIIYLPMIFLTKVVKTLLPFSKIYQRIPLSYYQNKSFRIIRNDSLDRFGTPLEKRFSKLEIKAMLKNAGLSNIVFSKKEPYWHAIGQKNK